MLPIFPDVFERTALSDEDVLADFASDEGLWFGVMLQQLIVDRGLEAVDAGVAAPADALFGDLAEEVFD